MNGKKPVVFLSSTVYDFRDLRSALKFWFEEFGYEVLASDWNDFRQDPAANSYESCLRAIDSADYFVLLIGGRVGGWYDEGRRISITRMEYRHAYERARSGHLRLLTFVRREFWEVREDRAALQRLLMDSHVLDAELSEADRRRIFQHASRFVNDADFVFDFLKEVGRISEMKQAQESSDRPLGNWVYRFSVFREVVDGCKAALGITGNIRYKALTASLVHELRANLAGLLHREQGRAVAPTEMCRMLRASFKGGPFDDSEYRVRDFALASWFITHAGVFVGRLRTVVLREAVLSGEYLEFDTLNGLHVVGAVQSGLLNLDLAIEYVRRIHEKGDFAGILERLMGLNSAQYEMDRSFVVANHVFAPVVAVYDGIQYLLELIPALLAALAGRQERLRAIESFRTSPFEEWGRAEAADDTDVDGWVRRFELDSLNP